MDNWGTPKSIMKMFEDWFDPCPLNENPTFDGLAIDWKDKTFVNPPYSKPLPWVIKAIDESKKGKRIVMLLKADTSTQVFKELVGSGATIAFIHKRLKFEGASNCATFPSMLVFL